MIGLPCQQLAAQGETFRGVILRQLPFRHSQARSDGPGIVPIGMKFCELNQSLLGIARQKGVLGESAASSSHAVR